MIPSVKEEVDVFIAGAGPVGMVLALTLRRAGVSVMIVDKAPTTRQHSQAAVLWPRTLDVLGLLDIGKDWEGQMAPIHAFDMTIDNAHATLDLQPVPSAHAYPQGVGQDVTERLLDHRLHESGADYYRGVEVVDVVLDGNGATTTLRDAGGNTHVVRSHWIVGCEGSHSLVRDKAGIEQVGDKNVGVQLLQGDVRLGGPMTMIAGRGGLWSHGSHDTLFILPTDPNGYYRVLLILPDKGEKNDPTLADLEGLAQHFVPGLTLHDPRWLNRYRTQHKIATNYRAGRAFVAGDAAHVWVPIGGQGMNIGMQDAFDLGWKLAGVITGALPEAALDTYTTERHPIGKQNIDVTERLYGAMLDPKSWIDKGLRKVIPSLLGFNFVEERLTERFAGLDVQYPPSLLVADHGHTDGPKAGMFAPDVWLNQAGDTVRLSTQLRSGQWLVLGWAVNNDNQTAQAALAQLPASDQYSVYMVDATPSGITNWSGNILRDIPHLATRALGVRQPCLHVIRPDGIIGYRGGVDLEPLQTYLQSLFSMPVLG